MSTAIPFPELADRIRGDVHADPLYRCMLATDASIFRQEPAAVVYPRQTSDVVQTVRFARENRLSVHSRGAGSGLCGSAVGSGIVIDFTRYMNRLIHLDKENHTVTCQPGYRLGELEVALAGTGLFFPPDPSSGEYATLGGMFATNASGARSVKYGNVSDYVIDAEVVLANGQVVTLADISRRSLGKLAPSFTELARLYQKNSETIEGGYPDVNNNVAGYNLRGLVRDGHLHLEKLLAGSEGTLGIVTRLSLKLIEKPAFESLVVAYFDDVIAASRAVQELLPAGPSGIEVMDKSLLELARESDKELQHKIPAGIDNVLLIEFDHTDADGCARQASDAVAHIEKRGLSNMVSLAVSENEKQRFWAVRKAAVPILYRLKSDRKILAIIEDAAVPTDRLVDYFKGIYAIMHRHNVGFVTYGHIAKGLLHNRPLLNLKTADDVALLKTLADDVFDLVRSLGGSVSGEHGDGRLRSAYVRRMYPSLYPLMLAVKDILDPENRFNPEIKTVHDAEQMTRHLRFGSTYRSRDLAGKRLHWPEGFVTEVEKCHGCTKCTTVTTTTRMCPVYKFTRDEAASPKAKANLLQALISGALSDGFLYEKTFQSVMDLCVLCGSCRHECPSQVNIPKLAAEAKSRHIEHFGPSAENRLLTSVEQAGRFTRKLTPFMRPVANLPAVRRFMQKTVGISARRDLAFSPPDALFDRVRTREGRGNLSVLYFSGCYAGYIRPEIGTATVRVLTKMEMRVYTPPQHCCGLPMLSKGMVQTAAGKVRSNLQQWKTLLPAVDYVVVSCSSCGYALMQEWSDLVGPSPASPVADRVVHLSHLVNTYRHRLEFRSLPGKVAYHQPCHLKIQPEADSTRKLLSKLPGVAVTDLASHCCGMMGSWGMTADHFDLSREIGSMMIDRLGDSDADVGVTDCPTCRMQMEQFGSKPVRHPIEIVAKRLKGG